MRDVPPADTAGGARPTSASTSDDAPAQPSRLISSGRLSRLDEEIEALRRSPTPTQSGSRTSGSDSPRAAARDSASSFLDGVAFMGIFSRTRDIIAANFNDMLDKADDPSKMIRMIILEMEETLVEVRASAARTIADQKEANRTIQRLEAAMVSWAEKAELALSKDREDLAKAALAEKQKLGTTIEQLRHDIALLDDGLVKHEADIQKLEAKLREARARQTTILSRLETLENRSRMRRMVSSPKIDEAFQRFDLLERRVDLAEGRVEAYDLGKAKTLDEEIAELKTSDAIDAELEAMKRKLAGNK